MPSRPILIATLAAVGMLAGCESLQRTDSFMGVIPPYRIDIVQGNAVTKEQLALLKPGMTRLQVRDILGTPLLHELQPPTTQVANRAAALREAVGRRRVMGSGSGLRRRRLAMIGAF